MKRQIALACCTFATGIVGCTDKRPSAPHEPGIPAPPGMVVSNARVSTTTLSSAGSSALRAAVPSTVAYVSAEPGTFPDAVSALLSNSTRDDAAQPVALKNAGFDPIGIAAEAGDELSLELIGSTSTVVKIRVPPRRAPAVVRTNPGKGRTDVALNVQILAVFSEPIHVPSVTPATLELLNDGVRVKGTVVVSPDGLSAELIPESPLPPATTFTLEIRGGITDIDGDALESPSTIPFRTVSGGSLGLGTLAFVRISEGKSHIYLSNPDGSGIRRLTNSSESEFTPAWSPDGQMLAFNRDDGTFIIRKDGSGLIRLPVGGGWPSWSGDGKRLLVAVGKSLRIVAADGSGENEVSITPNAGGADGLGVYGVAEIWAANWSPDGTRIAFASWTNWDFLRAFIINSDGSGGRTFVNPVQNAIWDECGPVWSPDGSRIALLGGVFGSAAFGNASFGVGVLDPAIGNVTTILATGTTCWDGNYGVTTSFSGIAWSPDGRALAITTRDPPWVQGQPSPTNQSVAIAIVDITTKASLAVIPDAFDPSWSRAK
jgi:hypothetical protein